ncbi:MAG: 4Fe-4S dicluster domain-containing protein, partial [Austwickia sp.]|nr:4Fe-4S dicluster domain-containing protein [Austwickia sp.]
NTGSAPEAHSVPVEKKKADKAFEAAACIGCGACVAACPNASGMLFMGAKVTHLGLLPQGQPERWTRIRAMVSRHDAEGFGGCTNVGACSDACPKEIPQEMISFLNNDKRNSARH